MPTPSHIVSAPHTGGRAPWIRRLRLAAGAALAFVALPAPTACFAQSLYELQGLPTAEARRELRDYDAARDQAARHMNLLAVERMAAVAHNEALAQTFRSLCDGGTEPGGDARCDDLAAQGRTVRAEAYLLTADIITIQRDFLLDHNHHVDAAVHSGLRQMTRAATLAAADGVDWIEHARRDLFEGKDARLLAYMQAHRDQMQLYDALAGTYEAEGLELEGDNAWVVKLARTSYANRTLTVLLTSIAQGYRNLASALRAPDAADDPFDIMEDLLAVGPGPFGSDPTRLTMIAAAGPEYDRAEAATRR